MIRTGLAALILATTFYGPALSAQDSSAQQPQDLKVELRSATGSNRFQLVPTEPYRYSINQYQCADLKSLEQKLLQFPPGSTFSVAHTGSLLDGWGDWAAIGKFLRSHGYSFRN